MFSNICVLFSLCLYMIFGVNLRFSGYRNIQRKPVSELVDHMETSKSKEETNDLVATREISLQDKSHTDMQTAVPSAAKE